MKIGFVIKILQEYQKQRGDDLDVFGNDDDTPFLINGISVKQYEKTKGDICDYLELNSKVEICDSE